MVAFRSFSFFGWTMSSGAACTLTDFASVQVPSHNLGMAAAKRWSPAHRGFRALSPGIAVTHRQGRKAMARAQKRQDAPDFHEWRKQIKALWYALRLIEYSSRAIRRDVSVLHRAETWLGDEHNAVVLCAELSKDAAICGGPVALDRVQIEVADVATTLRSASAHFDVVLLDVDNGPAAFTTSNNAALYDIGGLTAAFAALKPSGTLAVWSARDDQKFAQRLRRTGFTVQAQRVRGRQKKAGPRHTIFLGHKPPNSYSAFSE